MMKVSYCSTCFNRFYQLKYTLQSNIDAVKNDNLVEFILVDFNGDDSDEMKTWILENFETELNSGKLKYYQRIQKDFLWDGQVACNTSYRFATGDIIVNLDCDNFIRPNDSDIIRKEFELSPNILLHMSKYNFNTVCLIEKFGIQVEDQYKHFGQYESGDAGRFAILKDKLLEIGGYNELIKGMAYGDTDFIIRSLKNGLKYIHKKPFNDDNIVTNIPNKEDPIPEKEELYRRNFWIMYWRNKGISDNDIINNNLIANKSGFLEDLLNYTLIKPY
jgi:hypothetical protein